MKSEPTVDGTKTHRDILKDRSDIVRLRIETAIFLNARILESINYIFWQIFYRKY